MSAHALFTLGFAAVGALISFIFSLYRTFNMLSELAILSAFFTIASVILTAVFAGIEDHSAGLNPDQDHINSGVK